MKSSLARFLPESMNCYKIKQEAWINDRILVLTPDQQKKLSLHDYDVIKEIGDRFYRGIK